MSLFRIKVTNPDQGWPSRRPAAELLAGDVAQADGSALRLRRIVDRRDDRYVEQLSDPSTERVLSRVGSSLTEHREHGAAKPAYRRRQARRS